MTVRCYTVYGILVVDTKSTAYLSGYLIHRSTEVLWRICACYITKQLKEIHKYMSKYEQGFAVSQLFMQENLVAMSLC